jgi:hypothetical protein
MNRILVQRLILKDWYLHRHVLTTILMAGGLALGLFYRGGRITLVGMMTALLVIILLGVGLPTLTIVNERKKQNLPFVMSLPISPTEYTMAKILANILAFLVLWLAIVVLMLGPFARSGTYGGLLPGLVVAALAPFAAFSLILGVAIVVESEAWSIGTTIACNISYSFWWLIPGFFDGLKSPVAVWSRPILFTIGPEVAIIVLSFVLTFYFQSRKTDFI